MSPNGDAGDTSSHKSRALPSWQSLCHCECFFEFLSLHIILFPVTRETVSKSLINWWRYSAFSGANSSMLIRPIRCGRQDQIKVAVEVVERKEAKRRAKMEPATIELQKGKKSEGSSKLKAQQVVALQMPAGALNERRRRACQIHFFSPFSVLLCTSFVFKTRWLTVKEVFLLTNTWLVCKGDEATLMILMSNWLKCALHTTAK